jgi:hypothetical protein
MFRSKADKFKILSSYALGGVAIAFCLFTAATAGTRPELQLLLCIFGGTMGWCVGLYLTPTSHGEKEQLSEFSKVLLTLASGFGLGKSEQIAAKVSEWFPPSESESATRVLLFLCMLMLGALFTYISRLFVTGTEHELQRKRAKALADMRQLVTQLDGDN